MEWNFGITLFADDTILFDESEEQLEKAVDILNSECKENKP